MIIIISNLCYYVASFSSTSLYHDGRVFHPQSAGLFTSYRHINLTQLWLGRNANLTRDPIQVACTLAQARSTLPTLVIGWELVHSL